MAARPKRSGTKAGTKARTARKAPAAAKDATTSTATILTWDDDPDGPPGGRTTSSRPAPNLRDTRLRIDIRGGTPAPKQYTIGTSQFRFWVAAEALRRAADFWGSIVPASFVWAIGNTLPVHLDEGVDLNAAYSRGGGGFRPGLSFYHATVTGHTVFSAESPDVAAHELGHAVLDALRPQLFSANAAEVAAFHESFGDITALLTALQVTSLRTELVAETSGGSLLQTSRISRVAEQLGWAIRQRRPDAVDPDCLRNAVNSFFYSDPIELPPIAPATMLSSAPHSFSRVFTGAFFEILTGMFQLQATTPGEADLLRVTREIGRLIVDAVLSAPVVPAYYSQIASHILAADAARFAGRYRDVIKAAFVRRGILSLESAAMPVSAAAPATRRAARDVAFGVAGAAAAEAAEAQVLLPTAKYGLSRPLRVAASTQGPTVAAMSASRSLGSVEPPTSTRAAESFIEDLFKQGRIDIQAPANPETRIHNPFARKTHVIEEDGDALVLTRRIFDCGFDAR